MDSIAIRYYLLTLLAQYAIITGMIKGFADKETERLWKGQKQKAVPQQLRERAVAKLLSVDIANNVEELETPPGNRLHKLGGKRALCTMCIGVGQGIAIAIERV